MKQPQIQQIRRVLALEITTLHGLKNDVKRQINYWWREATPDTRNGEIAFNSLNYWKNQSRSLTRKITRLSILIKELKKEERKSLGH